MQETGSSGLFISVNRGGGSGGSEKDMPTSQGKPFDIPKLMVWEAYRKVRRTRVRREWTR
jgi:hypothetical protein